jgi:two-component system NtrC family sensor kinase
MTPEERERVQRLEQMTMLAAGLGHDFNNTAMCLLAELATLEARLGEVRRFVAAALGANAREPLRLLDACARSLETVDGGMQAAVLNNRELQRIHRGETTPVRPEGADLRRAAQRALRLVGSRLRPVAQLHDGDPIQVAANEDTIVRVLLNLLINASDAFAPGTLLPRVRLEISRQGAEAFCDVIDNGPGVDPRVLPRLFQPFVSSKPAGVGTGLGLAVSRQLVRAMGGELTLRETSSTGTSFRLAFPTLTTHQSSDQETRTSLHVSTLLTPPPDKEGSAGLGTRTSRAARDLRPWVE